MKLFRKDPRIWDWDNILGVVAVVFALTYIVYHLSLLISSKGYEGLANDVTHGSKIVHDEYLHPLIDLV